MKNILFVFIAIIFVQCTPENGTDGINGINGINGTNGTDGTDGISIGLETSTLSNGCKELTFFKDSNNNGIKDSSESVVSSFQICDGTTPNIKLITEDAESCANGGKVFIFFDDINDDGLIDSNETIIGTETICNGLDGQNGTSVSLFIEESSLSDCSRGGLLITVFIDIDGDGEYDADSESIITQTIACYPEPSLPTEGLVAYYPFEGNANDQSGNNNHGTVNGAVLTTDRFGNPNSAYEFDEDSIVVENEFYNNGFEEYTINLWFLTNNPSKTMQTFFNTIPHDGEAIGYNHGAERDTFSYFKNSNISQHRWDVFSSNPFGAQAEQNSWYMITVVKKADEYNYYINGALNKTSTATISAESQLTGLRFGSIFWSGREQEFLNGKLDDIGIWNRALTQFEITSLFKL